MGPEVNVEHQKDGLYLTTREIKHWWRFDGKLEQFIQQFKLYLTAFGAGDKLAVQKVAMLLTVAGPGAIDLYNTFVLAEADGEVFYIVVDRFDKHCAPRRNDVFERYTFRCRVNQETEIYDSFITDLRLKARTCNIENMMQSLILDQIVFVPMKTRTGLNC